MPAVVDKGRQADWMLCTLRKKPHGYGFGWRHAMPKFALQISHVYVCTVTWRSCPIKLEILLPMYDNLIGGKQALKVRKLAVFGSNSWKPFETLTQQKVMLRRGQVCNADHWTTTHVIYENTNSHNLEELFWMICECTCIIRTGMRVDFGDKPNTCSAGSHGMTWKHKNTLAFTSEEATHESCGSGSRFKPWISQCFLEKGKWQNPPFCNTENIATDQAVINLGLVFWCLSSQHSHVLH